MAARKAHNLEVAGSNHASASRPRRASRSQRSPLDDHARRSVRRVLTAIRSGKYTNLYAPSARATVAALTRSAWANRRAFPDHLGSQYCSIAVRLMHLAGPVSILGVPVGCPCRECSRRWKRRYVPAPLSFAPWRVGGPSVAGLPSRSVTLWRRIARDNQWLLAAMTHDLGDPQGCRRLLTEFLIPRPYRRLPAKRNAAPRNPAGRSPTVAFPSSQASSGRDSTKPTLSAPHRASSENQVIRSPRRARHGSGRDAARR